MSVRITDSTAVALYDSVTGLAFGEVFEGDDGQADAESFLEYLHGLNQDPRDMLADDLTAARLEWRENHA